MEVDDMEVDDKHSTATSAGTGGAGFKRKATANDNAGSSEVTCQTTPVFNASLNVSHARHELSCDSKGS